MSVTKQIMVEDQRSCKFNNYYPRPIGLFVSVPFVLKQYMQQNDGMSNDHAGIIKDIYKSAYNFRLKKDALILNKTLKRSHERFIPLTPR